MNEGFTSFPWPTYQAVDPSRPLEVIPDTVKIKVNKDTHRIKFSGETEHEVTVTIEPKE